MPCDWHGGYGVGQHRPGVNTFSWVDLQSSFAKSLFLGLWVFLNVFPKISGNPQEFIVPCPTLRIYLHISLLYRRFSILTHSKFEMLEIFMPQITYFKSPHCLLLSGFITSYLFIELLYHIYSYYWISTYIFSFQVLSSSTLAPCSVIYVLYLAHLLLKEVNYK